METGERGRVAVARADVDDLERQLDARRRAQQRHTLWALLGLSPGAAIPLVLWASEAGLVVLVVGALAVTGIEAWRAVRAKADAEALESRLRTLRDEWSAD